MMEIKQGDKFGKLTVINTATTIGSICANVNVEKKEL